MKLERYWDYLIQKFKFQNEVLILTDIFRIDDKVAVIIGGTGGIGRALSYGLAEYGARVVIVGTDFPKAVAIAEDIRLKHKTSEATAFKLDITHEQSIIDLKNRVVAEFGSVDILINAQGINVKRNAVDFSIPDWDRIFQINVRGTMLTCREFGKPMIEQKRGKIINLSSVRGIRATDWPGNTGYSATKASIDMFTRSLASEWAQYNINVNAIAPSTVATRFSEGTLKDPEKLKRFISNCPARRVAEPSDLVGACVFLASSASDYVTGQIIYVDGGLTAIG
jgi:NAD(P)-dependent dehydrogenase (short-subunit alcohol dehydrogenase family)